jgi:hypothetical protein
MFSSFWPVPHNLSRVFPDRTIDNDIVGKMPPKTYDEPTENEK